MVDINCPYLNFFAGFVVWESCLNTALLPSPGGIWSVHLLNRSTACVTDLLNHSELPKGCIMNLVGISFLISFGGGWGKIFQKLRMVKC